MKVTNRSGKVAPNKASSPAKPQYGNSSNKLGAKQLILKMVAESYSLGEESLPRSRLIRGTGIAAKTVTNNIAKLKNEGLIEYPDSTSIRLTSKGMKQVGGLADPPKTNAELQERIKEKLTGKKLRMVDLLSDGLPHSKEEIAVGLDFQSKSQKGFVNLLGSMRSSGFVSYPDNQTAELTDMWFPFGRDSE